LARLFFAPEDLRIKADSTPKFYFYPNGYRNVGGRISSLALE